jgi:hypothetical protein
MLKLWWYPYLAVLFVAEATEALSKSIADILSKYQINNK